LPICQTSSGIREPIEFFAFQRSSTPIQSTVAPGTRSINSPPRSPLTTSPVPLMAALLCRLPLIPWAAGLLKKAARTTEDGRIIGKHFRITPGIRHGSNERPGTFLAHTWCRFCLKCPDRLWHEPGHPSGRPETGSADSRGRASVLSDVSFKTLRVTLATTFAPARERTPRLHFQKETGNEKAVAAMPLAAGFVGRPLAMNGLSAFALVKAFGQALQPLADSVQVRRR
jgi:hypothetical protein